MDGQSKIIEVEGIQKSFKNQDGGDLVVIDDVYFTMYEGEIVALLGKSGSGKSTLLRIIAGLTPPTKGHVLYRGEQVMGPCPGITMVFQNFALLPWLTVLQNVELGLEAFDLSDKARRDLAILTIDIIGMDGFENAYPKELSGGMRQRVGVARALAMKPDLLLMDEPFSSLDVLTAESLRNDLLELWEKESHMKGILFVTHNIEEAVLLADRIIIFGSDPGMIRGELRINLPYPRASQDEQVLGLIDEVYRLMTTTQVTPRETTVDTTARIDISYRLPETSMAELIGLLEELEELQQKGPVDLPDLADIIRLDIDDLFPVLEALSILGLANISEGDISMTQEGFLLLEDDITDKKIRFRRLLLEHIPLARHIRDSIEAHTNMRVSQDVFLETLEHYFTESEAERVLSTMTDWARYTELYTFDYNTGIFSLEDVS